MANRVSATDLARRIGDILGRVRYRGESFLVERHNVPIAHIGPPPGGRIATLREVAEQWLAADVTDPDFATDLERIGAADRSATAAWDS